MRSNKMGLYIAEVSQHMKAHRDAIINALSTALPGATVRKPEGGYLLWVELPEGMSGDALVARSIAQGVEVSSGRVCFSTAAAENYLRLAYSFVGSDTICDGIRRLGIAYKELL